MASSEGAPLGPHADRVVAVTGARKRPACRGNAPGSGACPANCVRQNVPWMYDIRCWFSDCTRSYMTLITSPTEMMPDERRAAEHGDLGDPPVAHLAHDVVDVVVDVAGDGVARHDLVDLESLVALAPVVDLAQGVALAEDPHEGAVVIDHGERPDVVLDQPGDRLGDRGSALNGDDPPSLGSRTSRTCM